MSRSPAPIGPDGIAIIGMSGRFPGARDLDSFWANLVGGVESVARFHREELLAAGVDPRLIADPKYVPAAAVLEEIEAFDAEFFGYSPREAELIDPQQRLFLECAWAALEHSGYPPRGGAERVGVFAGSGLNGYMLHNVLGDPGLLDRVGPYQAVIGNDKDFLATRVSYKLGLEGPSLTLQTACSTSLVAICAACQSLLDGESDLALAGGVTVRIPQRAGYLYQEEGILSPDGHCRAFDASARGTVPGSGVGVVVLKPLARALADRDRVHAVIRGWAINNDGARKVGFTAPSVQGQSAAVAEALALADVDPTTISYIEAHGTGTRLGDPIEIAALKQVFGANGSRPRPCAIGSVKTNVGHLDAAAGVAGLIKTVLSLEQRELPPTLHFQSPNPEIDLPSSPFRVVAQRIPWEADGLPRRAGVSSFGIGGTNAHLVVEEAPAAPEPTDPSPSHTLLVVSARNEEALDRSTANLMDYLKRDDPKVSVHDVAYTLQTGRVAMPHRRAVVCADARSAWAALESRDPGRTRSGAVAESTSVAFLFPGQGAQHLGMGAGLYASSSCFQEELDRCALLLAPHLGLDLREALFRVSRDGTAARALGQTAIAQPALFAVEYSLARAWMDLGVTPEAMVGHSVGEYVAACLAGALPLEEALRVVAARGRLMQALPPGAMAAVPLAEAALVPLLPTGLSLAAVNAAELCTVSGPEEGIGALERVLAERGLESRRLHTSHAFHSAMMDPVLDAFRTEFESVAWGPPPKIPWISNHTGTWITPEEARSPEYWVRHLRETVRFAEGLETLLELPDRVLLEVGPGQTLTALARRQPGARGRRLFASMPHRQEPIQEIEAFLRAAGELWVGGVPLHWSGLHRGRRRSRVPLPSYPFERARHWLEAPRPGAGRRSGAIYKRPDLAEWLYLPTWKRAAPRDLAPPKSADRPAHWLVFEDGRGLGAALANALEASGARVSRARPGESFARLGPREYRVSPDRREDHEALLSALREAEGLPGGVLHLWSLPDGVPSDSDPQRGFTSLLACVQALAPRARGARIRIAVISEELQSVTGSERSNPERATVLGLCRVIPQEYPHFICRSLDVVTSGQTVDEVADSVLAEIDSSAEEPEVALRGSHRWVPSYDPLPLPAPDPPGEALLEPGAHVLIAGGLGRLGLALASHFARTRGARLTLIDRRSCPHRDRWTSLAEGDGDEEAATARALLELASAGAPFEVTQADVTDGESLARVVADAERRFGPVAAILHAAGPADEAAYRTIQEITPEHWAGHFAPKLAGIHAFAAVFQGRPPVLALVASSLAPVLGGIGLAAMAAADRFVGALVEQPPCPGGISWRAIDWEGWGQRWADRELAVLGREQIELMLTWSEVAEVLERALRARGMPRLVVSTGDLEARRAQWTRVLEGGARPATRAAIPSKGGRPLTEGTEASVAAIWCEVLGLEAIGADDDFFELGGNSLLGLQVLSRLRGTFEVEMPLRTFFEARTVAAMTRVIETERSASSDQTQRVAAILDEIESLSDEEIESRLLALPAGERAREEGA